MRALICEAYEGIAGLRIGELPDPIPGPGQVLVEVMAATVNFADILLVAGRYQLKPDLPFIPGSEASGVVEAANDASGVSVGDRVALFLPYGAMAEKLVVDSSRLLDVGDEIGFAEAATIPVAYGTAFHALVDRAGLEAGESLLVLGAAGGVGIAAVQIGKALGATVVAGVSSDEKATAVVQAGADHVIRYDTTHLREGLAATGLGGVDVVLDPVGGDLTELALRSTNWRGRLLVVGFASGEIPRIPINLTLVKGNAIVGVFWGRFTEEQPAASMENNRRILEWVAKGALRPRVQKTFSLDESRDALRWVAERNVIGRVVVVP